MVREHRLLTVKEGVNRIQFSWANTLIDPTSIEFRILDKQDKVDLVDTTFPPGRNDALQWNIKSQIAGKIPVEIRYFTQRHHLVRRLRGHRQRGRDQAQRDRLRAGDERVGRGLRQRPDAACGGQDQPGGEDRRSGQKAATRNSGESCDEGRRQQIHRYFDKAAKDGEDRDRDFADWAKTIKADLQSKKQVIKQGLSEYFLFTIEGREDIKDKEPKRLVALKVADVPLESIYKLTDRTGDQGFTKFYRFKNVKLLDEQGKEKKLSAMENLGLSPLPNGTVRLFSEYKNKDLAYVGGTETKYVPIGDRVEVNVGPDKDITIHRRLKDQKIGNVVARQYKRRLDDKFVLVLRPDRLRRDLLLRGRTRLRASRVVAAKIEVERQFDANVVLWGSEGEPKGWTSNEPGAYVDLHTIAGRVERVDQQHVKYFLDLKPGKKHRVEYSVTYKRRKVGPELNTERKREPL